MNPFDEIAVEEAVRLRERNKGVVDKIVCFRMLTVDCGQCWPYQVAGCAAHGSRDGRR